MNDDGRLDELLAEAAKMEARHMHIRDRIKEFRRVPASALRPNPKNWRTHPKVQQDALRGVLAEIGYADALLVRELPDGSLMLIDGHLRAETTPDMEVPILVLDVTEEEADYLLAVFDPLGTLAEADREKLKGLLDSVQAQNGDVQSLLANLAESSGIEPPAFAPAGETLQGRLDEKTKVKCPECGHEFTP